MDPVTVLLILLVSFVACAVAGASVAKEKGREPLEGVIYGAFVRSDRYRGYRFAADQANVTGRQSN